MRSLFIRRSTEGARVCVVVSAFEELGAYTGATGDKFPVPGAHADGELLDGEVEGPPMDLGKSVPRYREVMVFVQPIAYESALDRSVQVVWSKA